MPSSVFAANRVAAAEAPAQATISNNAQLQLDGFHHQQHLQPHQLYIQSNHGGHDTSGLSKNSHDQRRAEPHQGTENYDHTFYHCSIREEEVTAQHLRDTGMSGLGNFRDSIFCSFFNNCRFSLY